jgi:nucleoid DNA-binding protein
MPYKKINNEQYFVIQSSVTINITVIRKQMTSDNSIHIICFGYFYIESNKMQFSIVPITSVTFHPPYNIPQQHNVN